MDQAESFSSKLLINLLYISIGFLLLLSCGKDDDSNPNQTVRLKEIIHLQNGSEIKKFVLQYDGLDVIRISGYTPSKTASSNWTQSEDLSVYYIENRIESVQSDLYNGDWYQQKVKVDIFTSSNLVYRTLYYNYNPDLDDWEEDEKVEFHGDGSQLSSVNYFEWEGGGWLENERSDYVYNSGTLSSQKDYQLALTDWILTKDCEMVYNDENIFEIYESRPNQGNDYKFVFSYGGSNIESIRKYMDYEGDWMAIETLTFIYDQSYNLIEYESVNHQHHIINKYTFSYELGGHNLWHYLQSESIFYYPYPLPYPVLLIN